VTTEISEGRVDFDFRLDGKAALVTGGAAGIGAAIAGAYAAKGARIAVVDLNEAAATKTASGLPTESRGFHCDVADPDSVRGTVDAVLDVFGRVDILVNSAGVVQLAPAEELSVKVWNATIDVNLKGTFLMCQAVGSSML
jgi:NAD(P)-dependent dehydrogenase (short-subunit alcohol dehydrogenase family)